MNTARAKDLERARVFAEKAKSLNPDNPNILDTMGWISYRSGDMNQALNWLSKAQAKAPESCVQLSPGNGLSTVRKAG
jgi:Flp pilus assembly protein TadD